MQTDEELMSSYRKGDNAAFQILFQRYASVLLRLMQRGMSHSQDAPDLVQKTFLQLHRARHDFREGSLLRPWLMTIALNLKREHLRKVKRQKEQGQKLYSHRKTEETIRSNDKYDALEQAQTVEEVHNALAKLPEAQRQVIELHWFEGFTFPEIAEMVGASVSAVKVRAHRGYQALKGWLATEHH